MGIEQYHFIISGRVQGVGYRYSARNYASDLGLVGWVKNRIDGKVEMVAEGPTNVLKALLKWAEQGPRFAEVSNVIIKKHPATAEFTTFSIQ